MVITKRLKQLSIETPYSLDDLAALKYYYHLTDVGVDLVCTNASRNALSLFDTITRMQVIPEFDLSAKLWSELYLNFK